MLPLVFVYIIDTQAQGVRRRVRDFNLGRTDGLRDFNVRRLLGNSKRSQLTLGLAPLMVQSPDLIYNVVDIFLGKDNFIDKVTGL